jgi:phasin family protein
MSPLQSASFPFAPADLTRAWSDFKLPSFGVEAFLEAHRKNAVAWATANQVAFDGLQALAQRQGDLIRSAVDGCGKAAGDVLAAATLEEKTAKQADAARDIYVSAVTGFADLSDIAARANVAASDIVNARIAAAFDEFKALFDVPAAEVVAAAAAPLDARVEPVATVEQAAPAEIVSAVEEAGPVHETAPSAKAGAIVPESAKAAASSLKTTRRPSARR